MLNKLDVLHLQCDIEEIQQQIADLRRLLAVAVKKTNLDLVQTLVGCEAPLRALQVAMVKPFSITFYGEGPNLENMMIVASQVGVDALATKSCPCGRDRKSNPYCRCTVDQVNRFRNTRAFKRAMESDILVEVGNGIPGHPYPFDLETLRRFNDVNGSLFPCVEYRETPDIAAMRHTFESNCPRAAANHDLVVELARASQSLDVQTIHRPRVVAIQHYCEALQYRHPLERFT